MNALKPTLITAEDPQIIPFPSFSNYYEQIDQIELWFKPEYITQILHDLEELTPQYLEELCANSIDIISSSFDQEFIETFEALRNYRHKAYPKLQENYIASMSSIAADMPDYYKTIDPNTVLKNCYRLFFSLALIMISPKSVRDIYLKAFFYNTKQDLINSGFLENSSTYTQHISRTLSILNALKHKVLFAVNMNYREQLKRKTSNSVQLVES